MGKFLPVVIFLITLLYPFKASGQVSTYPPLPTGSQTACILEFQSPITKIQCADCLIQNKPEIRQFYDSAQHVSCNNVQIANHWCNGGAGLNAIADCNGVKNGICSQLPGKPCLVPTLPPGTLPTASPTPPATVNSVGNPRGCGILYTNGIPSCWCNNGGGQGLCGNIPLDGPNGCRDLCEKGVFTGARGRTHCFMMPDNSACNSHDNGAYKFCLKRCLPASPGFSQDVGCEYPNKTVFSTAQFDASCILAFNNSSNNSFFSILEAAIKGLVKLTDINLYVKNIVRVPGLQKADCNPARENCTFE